MLGLSFRPLAVVIALASTPALAADLGRFWNLTGETISSLTLAPAGTETFGANQCANDKDGTVDNDERLRLTNLAPGRYDVRIKFQRGGRMCIAHDVVVKDGGKVAFTLEPKDLKDCK